MNNFILISKTYCETTPESAEHGDFSDQGFISEVEQVSFKELVGLMKYHNNPSCSPNDYTNTHTWYSADNYISDYRTCTSREESIHFHRDNTVNATKYWHLAARLAAKAILFFIIIMAGSFGAMAQNAKQEADSNYVTIKKERATSTASATDTGLHITDIETGIAYKVYQSARGKRFYLKISKTGKTYKSYIKTTAKISL